MQMIDFYISAHLYKILKNEMQLWAHLRTGVCPEEAKTFLSVVNHVLNKPTRIEVDCLH